MTARILTRLFLSGALGLVLATSLGGPAPAWTDVPEGAVAEMAFPAGTVVRIALEDERLGRRARESRDLYADQVVPFLEANGLRDAVRFDVDDALYTRDTPSTVRISALRDTAVLERLEAHRDWPDVVRHHADGWSGADVFTTELDAPLELRFDPEKFYTLAIAWADPDHPGDYNRYLDGVAEDFERVGARFVHKFRDLDYATRQGGAGVPPLQITLVEWDRADGLAALLSGSRYREHRPLFDRGVSEFRFYRLGRF